MADFGGSRQGLSENSVELENRIQKLEIEIAQRQVSNIQGSTSADIAVSSDVPQVTGLRVSNNIVGGLGFEWNQPRARNLTSVEVEISTVPGFSAFATQRIVLPATTTSYVYAGSDPTQIYYVRVRAISGARTGYWSSSLNMTTGQATMNHLLTGAATEVVRTQIVGNANFSPAALDSNVNNVGVYAPTDIETVGGTLLIFATATVSAVYPLGTPGLFAGLIIDLLEDEEVIQSAYSFNTAFVPQSAFMTLPNITLPVSPDPGLHTYQFRLTLTEGTMTESPPTVFTFTNTGPGTQGSLLYVYPQELTLSLIELRR